LENLTSLIHVAVRLAGVGVFDIDDAGKRSAARPDYYEMR